MQIPDRQPASSDKIENRTAYKSDRKGWVWRKKGDKCWSHCDTLVPEHPPHRVGLARQLQGFALTNSREASEPPPSK